MPVSSIHRGWRFDRGNSRLDFFFNGSRQGHINSSGMSLTGTLAVTGAQTFTGAATFSSTIAGSGDMTLTGNGVDYISASGNLQVGNPGTFATTQPRGAVVMGGSSLNGVAPDGAITTAGGIFASDTVVRKIIADGTASNVET